MIEPDNSKSARRYERAKDTILVNYRIVDFERDLGDFDEGMTASTLDLSAGGMRLRMTESFKIKTLLDLRFRVRREGKEMTVLSTVVRSDPAEYEGMYYISVEYPMLSDEDRSEIDTYVKEINTRSGH